MDKCHNILGLPPRLWLMHVKNLFWGNVCLKLIEMYNDEVWIHLCGHLPLAGGAVVTYPRRGFGHLPLAGGQPYPWQGCGYLPMAGMWSPILGRAVVTYPWRGCGHLPMAGLWSSTLGGGWSPTLGGAAPADGRPVIGVERFTVVGVGAAVARSPTRVVVRLRATVTAQIARRVVVHACRHAAWWTWTGLWKKHVTEDAGRHLHTVNGQDKLATATGTGTATPTGTTITHTNKSFKKGNGKGKGKAKAKAK